MILSRSIRKSIIREWKLQVLKAFCLLIGILIGIILYPNDIGSDSFCSIEVINEYNMRQITGLVFDFINGKRSNGELNVAYMAYIIFYFAIIYMVSLILVFSNQIKVGLCKVGSCKCY